MAEVGVSPVRQCRVPQCGGVVERAYAHPSARGAGRVARSLVGLGPLGGESVCEYVQFDAGARPALGSVGRPVAGPELTRDLLHHDALFDEPCHACPRTPIAVTTFASD